MKTIHSKKNLQVVQSQKAFVGFLPTAYPSADDFLEIIKNAETSGVDIFEFGYPPKDPFADGEVIKSAYQAVDYDTAKDLKFWTKIRETISAPIWIMGYAQDLVATGDYLNLAKAGVVDAFVIPDITLEESEALSKELGQHGVDIVCFAQNDADNIDAILEKNTLVYYQLVKGVTGSAHSNKMDFSALLEQAESHENTFIFGGFGINNDEQAKSVITQGFDGIIVGTEMVRQLNTGKQNLYKFIQSIKSATT